MRWIDRASLLIAALFGAGLCMHLAALIMPTLTELSSPQRHLVFIAVNGLFGILFGLRWRYVIIPVVPLVFQQSISHGRDFMHARAEGRFDAQSVLVFIFMPLVFAVAMQLARRTPPP